MATTLRFRRRVTGAAGAPSSLKTAEVAYNMVDGKVYIGYGDDGNGNATSIRIIGQDNYVDPATLYQPKDNDLTALAALSTTGLLARTAADTYALRTMAGTAGRVVVTNGDGVAGSPTLDLATVAVGSNVAGGYTKFTVDGYGRLTNAGQASLNDLNTPTADFSHGGFRITNLAAGTAAGDAVNLAQLNAVRQGMKFKEPARASGGAANINIANPGTAVFDGITLATGETLLLYSQTAPAENGKYTFNGSAAALTRTDDMDTWAETIGAVVGIAEGSSGIADTARLFTSNAGGTIGTTALTNISFGGGVTNAFTTAGAGLVATNATTVAVNPGTGITVASNAVALTGQALALHNVTTAADQLIYATGAATFSTTAFGSFGRSLVGAADAATARTTLGLGTMATQAASGVAITGGTIEGVVLDGGSF